MKKFKTVEEARDYSRNNPIETVELKLYYNNGKLEDHYFYINGKLHGEFKWYYDNGQLRDHSCFVNGLEHGEFKTYYDDGQLCQHYFYVNGNRHGEFKSYYSDGRLYEHIFYINSKTYNVDHLKDRSYKSLCIKHTLFDGNLIDDDI